MAGRINGKGEVDEEQRMAGGVRGWDPPNTCHTPPTLLYIPPFGNLVSANDGFCYGLYSI